MQGWELTDMNSPTMYLCHFLISTEHKIIKQNSYNKSCDCVKLNKKVSNCNLTDSNLNEVCAGGNCISVIQRSEVFLKPTFGHDVNRHHVFSVAVNYGIRYLKVPFSYGVTATNDSEMVVYLLYWAKASLLSLHFLAMHPSYSCLWCFFKCWYWFVVLPCGVATVPRHALNNAFFCRTSVVSNPKYSHTTEVLPFFGNKLSNVASGSAKAIFPQNKCNIFPLVSSVCG